LRTMEESGVGGGGGGSDCVAGSREKRKRLLYINQSDPFLGNCVLSEEKSCAVDSEKVAVDDHDPSDGRTRQPHLAVASRHPPCGIGPT
jgi:hypothetical protein